MSYKSFVPFLHHRCSTQSACEWKNLELFSKLVPVVNQINPLSGRTHKRGEIHESQKILFVHSFSFFFFYLMF